jgi:hypothetical protein
VNFWVGVVFFCFSGECAFWKSEEIFDTKVKCEKALDKALDTFEKHTDVSFGTCLQIRMTREI